MNQKAKKIVNICARILTWTIFAFAVFMLIFTIVTVTTVDRNDRSIFGVKFYIVQSDSMRKSEKNKDMDIHFKAGDIVLIENLSEKKKAGLKAGDVIAFVSTNDVSYLETVTHMIREVKYNAEGKTVGYVTFGTNTGVNDEALVEPDCILGKYKGKLPGVGRFFAFVKSTPGYVVCILLPFLLLIGYNGVNVIRIVRSYRKEQAAVAEAAREAEIAEERKKNEEMLRELQALKEQLAKQNADATAMDVPSEAPAEDGADV